MKYCKLNDENIVTQTQPSDAEGFISCPDNTYNGMIYDETNETFNIAIKPTDVLTSEMISMATEIITTIVSKEISIYNKANNISLEGINSCVKYTLFEDYLHYDFCINILTFNKDIFEKGREIQTDIINGDIDVPTEEEFIDMLPTFS